MRIVLANSIDISVGEALHCGVADRESRAPLFSHARARDTRWYRLGRSPVCVGQKRLGLRYESRCTDAAVEHERSLQLCLALLRVSFSK